MNANSHNPFSHGAPHAASCNAEETLQVIANLPAPDGLEDRIHEALRSAPRRGLIRSWPAQPFLRRDWMRTAAAAAIAFVVAGGGWGVYSRVQQGQPARMMAMPQHVAAPGSFSSAGAIRTPQTLNGPVLAEPAKAHAAPGKMPKKAVARHPSGVGARMVVQPSAAPSQ